MYRNEWIITKFEMEGGGVELSMADRSSLFIFRAVESMDKRAPSTKVHGADGVRTMLKGLMKTRVPKLGQWRNPRACNLLRI